MLSLLNLCSNKKIKFFVEKIENRYKGKDRKMIDRWARKERYNQKYRQTWKKLKKWNDRKR